jgi:anthranilate synthase component 2
VTTLIVDNYDSFTFNLYQLVGALGGRPTVVRNDAVSLDDVRRIAPARIVLSPGPGRPDDDARIGVCKAILADPDFDIPVLGVCLGHQAIVCAYGGKVVRTRPMHGKTSLVHHDGDGILRGLPRPFEAMRYHSLAAEPESIPDCLAVTAWCNDGSVMAVRHRAKPIAGVQFHPESIGTTHGRTLVESFLAGVLE